MVKTRAGHALVAVFHGEMDYLTGPMFRTEFLSLLDSGDRFVVLDVAGVPFCDSAGLNALLAAHRHAKEIGAELVLAALPEQLRQLLRITGVDEIIDIYDSAQEAAAAADG
ncbi:anti-sigma factor antagonist [Streptomyces dangxiongensis]|uniref:Anti-sigma factor antagonist n=1 Tax=Streptomyces dangxiongensis TaxID=1442032 RepID=A0A3G2JDS1_9ACTN|nr:anti-sigma factor antagonist [Streptomyces dangxiongensis]